MSRPGCAGASHGSGIQERMADYHCSGNSKQSTPSRLPLIYFHFQPLLVYAHRFAKHKLASMALLFASTSTHEGTNDVTAPATRLDFTHSTGTLATFARRHSTNVSRNWKEERTLTRRLNSTLQVQHECHTRTARWRGQEAR